MDKKDALELAQQYVRILKPVFNCKQVYLFGSYARGANHEESDIDIAVILDDYINVMDIQLELMRLRRQIDSRIEPHPFREKDFELSNPLVYEIVTHGEKIAL